MKIFIVKKLEEKKISRYELAKKVGVTYPTIDKIYKGESSSIKFEVLDAICNVLECTPNDIIISDDPQVSRLLEYEHQIRKLHESKGDTE